MKRQIIKIDEHKCNGCGICTQGCPEGALKLIDGKAKLVGELYCDGLGACIGNCPEGAITIEEREAVAYDERKTMENIIKEGPNVINAHLKHLKDHGQEDYYNQALEVLKEKGIVVNMAHESHQNHHGAGGCPGSKIMDFRSSSQEGSAASVDVSSQLSQWPIQLHLLNPHAPYFKDAELVVAADCVPFAFANFHARFLKGKILIIFCPKLDNAHEVYLEKLKEIFSYNNIKSVSVVHMEVPCCSGTLTLVEKALERSQKHISVREYTISLDGKII
ncbi:MAG TPA: 4Fe-4S binding protein [Candidatus Omnitrophota bacterium]|nr:4Fe-4S binding protein [Candidatus Omnitrophota bacterium]HPN88491.1 4Fe-4S binding protein [Candidatus Omnitrophota bacterium]